MLRTPIALQEQEREHEVPLDTPNEQFGKKNPDLHSDAGRSEGHGAREYEGQGTAAERAPAVDPEHPFDDDQLGEGAQDNARSRTSEGKCRCPGYTISINSFQVQRGPWRTSCPDLPRFSSMSQTSPQMDSVFSMPS